MTKPRMTEAVARAAATDAGTRSMRNAGRKRWGKADWNAASAEYKRLSPPTRYDKKASQ